MKKIFLLIGLAVIGFIIYHYRKQIIGSVSAISILGMSKPKTVAPNGSGDVAVPPDMTSTFTAPTRQTADIYAKDADFLFAPNVLDSLGTSYTQLLGGLLTARYANWNEVSISSQVVGQVGQVDNKITVTNTTGDTIQFGLFSQIVDANGFELNIDKQSVTLAPKQSKSVDFVQTCPAGMVTVESFAWTSIVNPLPVTPKVTKTVRVN